MKLQEDESQLQMYSVDLSCMCHSADGLTAERLDRQEETVR